MRNRKVYERPFLTTYVFEVRPTRKPVSIGVTLTGVTKIEQSLEVLSFIFYASSLLWKTGIFFFFFQNENALRILPTSNDVVHSRLKRH